MTHKGKHGGSRTAVANAAAMFRSTEEGREWTLDIGAILAWLERTERWHVGRTREPCAICGGGTPWATVAVSGARTPSHLACVYGEVE